MRFSSLYLRLLGGCFALLVSGLASHAGLAPYTDPGKTDFDTALQLLNPYGTWSKINGQWAYTPLDHQAPYTDGRWLYTEFGWYWKGNRPHSWVTEHYGYWKRGANQVWSWYPGPYWLSEIVELRSTTTHLGWRSAAVDSDGNFIEPPADRYTKTDEWTFVTLAQFAGPITPGIIAPPDVTRDVLEDSVDSHHSYWTYRAIDRPGPHPADFLALAPNSGMFAPQTTPDDLPPKPLIPSLPPPVPVTNSPAPPPMTGTNAPTLLGTEPEAVTDQRRVRYWIIMSLPTYWTPPPADAKPEELYIYRPDFYQDEDGIARRITLWFNPKARTSLKDIMATSKFGGKSEADAPPSTGPSQPATPAEPVNAHAQDPFRSPFDDPYRPGSTPRSSSTSSKAPTPAPSTNAPIPLPLINTNAAPVNPR